MGSCCGQEVVNPAAYLQFTWVSGVNQVGCIWPSHREVPSPGGSCIRHIWIDHPEELEGGRELEPASEATKPRFWAEKVPTYIQNGYRSYIKVTGIHPLLYCW